ncbi:MAG: DUF2225 domain-containing protein [Eubacteriales bacterium]|nr:DUF2225 domain-containing protein [Eubacteriales bacterium]MDD4390454.1 DUF2225 domain-containing protein [Eubacteriales bacterium]
MFDTTTLLKFSTVKQYPKGTVIVSGSDSSPADMFILLQGSAGAYKNYKESMEVLLDTFEAGSFFGQMSLFLNRPSDATVVALADCIAVSINSRNIYEFFSSQPAMTFKLIEDLCKRLDKVSNDYIDLHYKYVSAVGIEDEQKASVQSSLFPEEHSSYLIPLKNKVGEYLFEDDITCPMCGHKFKNLTVFTSRLRTEGSDKDMRIRFKGIEPMHYEVISCPSCCYSALNNSFSAGEAQFASSIAKKISALDPRPELKSGIYRDTFTIFAGYYLAILCAQAMQNEYHLNTAKLWMRLGRIYSDCGDENMSRYANQKALSDYKYAYERFDVTGAPLQQLCFIIGDLYNKLDNIEEARTFFFYAKMNKDGSAVVKRRAEVYLDDLREELKKRRDDEKKNKENA